MLPGLLAALALAISPGEAPPPPADDEARIEELMGADVEAREAAADAAMNGAAGASAATDPANAPFPPPSGSAVAFEDLSKLVGYRIRVHIGPRARVGAIEKADKNAVTMKAPMGGGYAKFTLSRAQIDAIELL